MRRRRRCSPRAATVGITGPRGPVGRTPLVPGLVAVGLMIVALSGAAAAGAGPTAPGGTRLGSFPPARPTRVLALGDSVMEGAAGELVAALPDREVVVDTEVSRSTSAGAEAALARGTDWDVVVILLGHNDGGSPGVYQPPYRRLLDALGGVPQVVVLTLHEVRPYYADVNAFLRGEAARRTNVRVADWNAALAATGGATAGDGLHLTRTGARLMAGLVAGQVVAAEAEAAPPPTTVPPTTAAPPAPTTTTPPTSTAAPATTTSTSTTTSPTPPARLASTSRTEPTGGQDEGGAGAQDDGDPASPLVGVVLVVAAVLLTLGLSALARRLPR